MASFINDVLCQLKEQLFTSTQSSLGSNLSSNEPSSQLDDINAALNNFKIV